MMTDETKSKCGVCGAKADSPLCWPCAKKLHHALVGHGDSPGLMWYIDRLGESAYGGAKLGCTKQRRGTETPLPINERPSALLRDITTNLNRWLGLVYGQFAPVPPKIAAHLLAGSVGRIMGLEVAPSMLQTVRGYNAAALRIINRPPEVYCGPCSGTLQSGEPCGYELRAEEDAQHVVCRRCGAVHDVAEIRADLLDRVYAEPQPADNLLRIIRWFGTDIRRADFYARIRTVNPRMYEHPDGRRNLRREPGSVALYGYGDILAALNDGDAVSPETSGTRRQRRRPRRNQEVSQ
jgi:hypothetical protein